MKKSRKALIRFLALFMIIAILNTVFFPTVCYALTSYDTQPEITGYQPVDATDNVSLTSGKFNYTVPITSIPEYPMAIGYSSGMGMDNEASAFGFGFNSFPGAISRNLMGLPDDINGGKRTYNYSNQKKWDASLTGSLSAGIMGASFGPLGIGAGASISLTVGYNNYKGVYGAFGIGLGVGAKLGGSGITPAGGIGGSLVSDSRANGVVAGGGASIGLSVGLWGNTSTFASVAGYSASKVMDNNSKAISGGFIAGSLGKSIFSSASSNASTCLSPLSYVFPVNTGFGASLTIPIVSGVSLTASYSQFEFGNGTLDKNAYGFMYLGSYSRARDQIADFTIEGESSFDNRNSPSYLQRDFFTVNTMGLAGSMQLYQEKYGVVSRNYSRQQYRDFSLLDIQTERKEVYPWVNVTQTKTNKGLDIIAMLKDGDNPEDKDFDKLLFDETERVNLTTEKYRFGNAEFKMRGDYTGEYNMASGNYADHAVNPSQLVHVEGTGGGPEFGFIKEERDMPLYYPETPSGITNGNKLERSTNIIKRTVGELTNSYSALVSKADGTGSSTADAFNFNQSFYSHYALSSQGSKGSAPVAVSSTSSGVSTFNILKHLSDIKNASAATKDAIGSIEIQSNNGLKYFFNLPVFNKSKKSIQLTGKGTAAPVKGGADYESFSGTDRNKLTVDDSYSYPYAWLLTAVVGEDYIDFDNIPGPSDGDIGYWVKFKYIKTADAYRWRMPFTGMQHFPNALYKVDDDVYSVTTGTKEIYYLAEIESSNYLCKYTVEKRFDGADAAAIANGAPYNSITSGDPNASTDLTGSNFQFLVSRIDLYKKHFEGKNSEERSTSTMFGTPIKSTVFKYDYSTSSNVPNNYSKFISMSKSSVDYFYNPSSGGAIGTGKATLRQVQHIAYDENGNANNLPSYEFKYWGDNNATYNPAYDREAVDQWGNYNASAKKTVGSVNYYHHFPQLDKASADQNAKVFNMSQVVLPSGGNLDVDYEAQSYGYVEDQKPYAMRQLMSDAVTLGNNAITVAIDITDLHADNYDLNKVISAGQTVYGEFTFYKTPKNPSPGSVYVSSGEAKVSAIGSVMPPQNGRYYQQVTLVPTDGGSYKPFVHDCEVYMYTESDQIRAIKENSGGCGAADVSRYESMENDGPLDAAKKVVSNIRSLFSSSNYQGTLDGCYGHPGSGAFAHQSFIRTPIYKGKYTGNAVKSISLSDNFQYSSNTTDGKKSNVYGTRYYYDENSNNTGLSAGVATIEPGGGKSCVIDMLSLSEVGFAPSPQIISGLTTIENAYQVDDAGASANAKVSRKKGKTVYAFCTPKDAKYHFKDYTKSQDLGGAPGVPNGNFFLFGIWAWLIIRFKVWGIQVQIEIPLWIPMTVKWNREDRYNLKSYSYTDYSDMFGKPSSIRQLDNQGVQIGAQEFEYFAPDEPVPLVKNGFGTSIASRPGKMDQAWSEAYYTKETNIDFIPWVLFMKAQTGRNFSFTNMKYSYVPPVLKQVTSTYDGMKTVTTNTAFDYYTGSPLEVKSNDSYFNTKISRTTPAYWNYPEMGPSYSGGATNSNANNLVATTANYMYLNQVDNNHVLGAGVTEWSKSNYNIVDYLAPRREYVSSTTYKYMYEHVGGNSIKSAYGSTANGSNAYIARHSALYKPYKSYTYEANLNTDGTFQTFQPFGGSGWKLLNTNELYSQNGVLVQSKDALGKYATQLIGYNTSNTMGNVSNASYGASVFEGAENMYYATNFNMLECDRVAPLDATIIEACNTPMLTKTLKAANFPVSQGDVLGNLVDIRVPSSPVYNKPFAKIDVVYKHNTNLKRSFFISLNDNREFDILSNKGENFNGFFTFSSTTNNYQLVFNPNDFASFKIDASYTNSGFTVSEKDNSPTLNCSFAKSYQVPTKDCASECHSGKYAFSLKGGGYGTKYKLSPATVPDMADLKRKYKAMVWVHNSSPIETKFIVRRSDANDKTISSTEATLTTPYARAGNWSLLRIDFDASVGNYSTNPKQSDFYEIYLFNGSTLGAATYDDYRVLPFNAEMTNVNYDPKFNRVNSTLDKDNFAGFSTYDARGRVTESGVEVQKTGKNVVQKFMYNDQKKN